MAVATTVVYNSNDRERDKTGDLITVIYECTLTGNYPAGGEVLDLSNEFMQVYGGSVCHQSRNPATVPAHGCYVVYQSAGAGGIAPNLMCLVTGAGAGLFLDELAAGAYPANMMNIIRIMVVGRPVTNAAI